jgi:hypothetical protein
MWGKINLGMVSHRFFTDSIGTIGTNHILFSLNWTL